ncbi:hypothetical protein D3C77_210920 [compost metagenome]
MMNIDDQHILLLLAFSENGPQQRSLAKIERRDEAFGDILYIPVRINVQLLNGKVDALMDSLNRLAPKEAEGSPQGLMTRDQRLKCLFQPLHIKPALDLHHERHVVCSIHACHAIQNKQPLLRRGHRIIFSRRGRLDG